VHTAVTVFESVTGVAARLYIGVHARVADVTGLGGVVAIGDVHLLEDALRAAAFAWPLPAFTRWIELTNCFMAWSI
jgi:hypothetical protein